MVSKASDQLAERAARIAAGDPPAEPVTTQVSNSATAQLRKSASPRLRTKPVKVSVALSPVEHRELARLTREFADETELTDIAHAELFRALLQVLLDDMTPGLWEAVTAHLVRSGGSRR